jgi:hypothetical protein
MENPIFSSRVCYCFSFSDFIFGLDLKCSSFLFLPSEQVLDPAAIFYALVFCIIFGPSSRGRCQGFIS